MLPLYISFCRSLFDALKANMHYYMQLYYVQLKENSNILIFLHSILYFGTSITLLWIITPYKHTKHDFLESNERIKSGQIYKLNKIM